MLRIGMFLATNFAVMMVASIVFRVFGIDQMVGGGMTASLIYCALFGMIGSFISLAQSFVVATGCQKTIILAIGDNQNREFRTEPGNLNYLDIAGRSRDIDVPPGTAAFTVCRVPVVVRASDAGPLIAITRRDGTRNEVSGSSLDQQTSRQIFDHTADITRLDVFVPRHTIRR